MSVTDEVRIEGTGLPALFEHVKRKDWGLAIIAWEKPTKRGYQFEDGKLRVIKAGFYPMMVEVDRPADRSAALVRKLHRQVGISEARRELRAEANAKGDVVITLEDQVEIINALYPNGFVGESWNERFRPDVRGDHRRLKRHRSFAIAHAKHAFDKQTMESRLSSGDHVNVIRGLQQVVDGSDIIRPAHVKTVTELPESHYEPVAVSLYGLLHGEGDFAPRFDAFVSAFPGKVSWSLSTAIAALHDPRNHVPVHTTSFQRQAKWMAPRLKHSTTPTGAVYLRYLDMAQRVVERLEAADFAPRDLVDVYDFVRITLRPSSIKTLDKVDS